MTVNGFASNLVEIARCTGILAVGVYHQYPPGRTRTDAVDAFGSAKTLQCVLTGIVRPYHVHTLIMHKDLMMVKIRLEKIKTEIFVSGARILIYEPS